MDINKFELKLKTEQKELIEQLSLIAIKSEVTGDWLAIPNTNELGVSDENEEADATEEWNSRNAIVAQLETRLRNIERALMKITDGTFGVCEISGAEIEKSRLEVNPAARTNIANIDKEKELSI